MTLRTYCSLRGDKVLNVPSLFSRVDHTGSFYGSAVYFFTLSVSQADHKLTSSASKRDRWDFMQYVAFEFRGV